MIWIWVYHILVHPLQVDALHKIIIDDFRDTYFAKYYFLYIIRE